MLVQWGLTDGLKAVAAFPEALQVRDAETGGELGRLTLGSTMMQRYGAQVASFLGS